MVSLAASGTGGAGGPAARTSWVAAAAAAATSEAAAAAGGNLLPAAVAGGGGSSFAVPAATGVVHTQGGRAGNGEVTITLVGSGMTLPDGTFRIHVAR